MSREQGRGKRRGECHPGELAETIRRGLFRMLLDVRGLSMKALARECGVAFGTLDTFVKAAPEARERIRSAEAILSGLTVLERWSIGEATDAEVWASIEAGDAGRSEAGEQCSTWNILCALRDRGVVVGEFISEEGAAPRRKAVGA